jgi:hypothetical protein
METVCPASIKTSTTWDPINPAPPVTNIFMNLPHMDFDDLYFEYRQNSLKDFRCRVVHLAYS